MFVHVIFVIFSLSTAPSPEKKRGKKFDTRLKRWTIALLDTRSTNKRVERKGRRTEKKSISFSTVPTTGEFVIINTRFFCVAKKGKKADDSIRVRAKRDPLFWCVLFCSRQRRKENFFGRMNSGEQTKPEHIFRSLVRLHQSTFFAPHFVRRGVEDLRRYASECEITRTTKNKYVTSFSLFLFLDDDDALVEF